MPNKTFTLNVSRIGDHFEVTIPEIGATATGTTFQEAVENGERAIVTARVNAATKKPRKRVQRHSKVS